MFTRYVFVNYSTAVQAHAISADTDLMLKGHVSWVGQSSIEVTMNVEEVG